VESLEQRIAAFTIGEAATATLVEMTREPDDFYFTFKTTGDHVGLCMIPLPGVELFNPSGVDSRLSPGKFFSLSQELADVVGNEIVALYRSDARLHGRYDICFGHEVSERVCERVTRALGVHDVYFPTHRRYGNTASASIPLGMSTAQREGHLVRGSRVLVIVGASGVSAGFGTFTF